MHSMESLNAALPTHRPPQAPVARTRQSAGPAEEKLSPV
jgi:hypothetical protein